MNEKETKFLLDVFERFGDKAQQALEFMRRNQTKVEARPADCDAIAAGKEAPLELLPNGVYFITPIGEVVPYFKDACCPQGTRVGINWYGHRWCLGKDYGDLPWTEANDEERIINHSGIMKEYEAVIEWGAEAADKYRRKFFKHIPFADGEMMPTYPMLCVQEHLAKEGDLNAALKLCGLPMYKVGTDRWAVERCGVDSAYLFGKGGYICNSYVANNRRVQAVTAW